MNTMPDSTQRTRRQQRCRATDVVFEINLADGAEAERLGLQQAAVIRDLLLWRRKRQQRVIGHERHLTDTRRNGLHHQASALKPLLSPVPILWCSRRGHQELIYELSTP